MKACPVDGSNDFNFLWLCHPGSLKTGNLGHPALVIGHPNAGTGETSG